LFSFHPPFACRNAWRPEGDLGRCFGSPFFYSGVRRSIGSRKGGLRYRFFSLCDSADGILNPLSFQ
jgi:hypothetical protein